MINSESVRKPALRALAVVFIGITLAYATLWMYSVRWQPAGSLGLHLADDSLEIVQIDPGGPADVAGMKPFDFLIDVDGRPVTTQLEVHDLLRTAGAGTPVRLTVRLAGLGDRPRSFDLTLAPRSKTSHASWFGLLARQLGWSYPALLVMLLAAVLFPRSERVEPWLVAATIAGMIATAPLMSFLHKIPPDLRGFAVGYKVVAWAMAPALLYLLLAVFPEPTPLDRRWPWLKSAWPTLSLVGAMICTVWLVSSGVAALPQSSLPGLGLRLGWLLWAAAVALGLVSLVSSHQEARSIEEERPIRILICGFVAALAPALLLGALSVLAQKPLGDLSVWLWFPVFVALFSLPLALGYAVSTPQPLDLPVLFKRLARFMLVQRGATGLALLAGGISGVGLAQPVTALTESRAGGAVSGLLLGGLVFWGALVVHRRFVEPIDRALFCDSHRARRILEDLCSEIESLTTLPELVLRLEQQIETALLPSSFALYVTRGDSLEIERGDVDTGLERIPLDQPLDPPEIPAVGSLDRVAQLGPDCLVPIGGDTTLLGLLVLGPRRTDEPYSTEEKRLLASAATQAGRVIGRLTDAG